MTLQDFINTYRGVPNVGNTPQNKGECVGLVSVWMDTLGIPHEWGNAKDLLTNADQSKFDVIYNAADNFPLPGDIFICGASWGGGAGHTGIIIKADVNSWTAFEQNNPEGHAPQVLTHNNYNGMLGWLHPKSTNSPVSGHVSEDVNKISDQTKIDLGSQLGQLEVQAIRSQILDMRNQLGDKDLQIHVLQQQLSECSSKLVEIHGTNLPITEPVAIIHEAQLSKPTLNQFIDFFKDIFR